MGRADTPLRRILNYAQDHFCRHLPLVFVLTVIGPRDDGTPGRPRAVHRRRRRVLRAGGRALGRGELHDARRSRRAKMVVYLDPEEFHSTWLGNKAIYRTRMAIADGGELIVLGPGRGHVRRRPGDRPPDPQVRLPHARPRSCDSSSETDDLPQNLSAAAHLIHGSSEGRFTITYCPGKLTPRGDRSGRLPLRRSCSDARAATTRKRSSDGWNTLPDGERIYYISNPALGLWAYRKRLPRSTSAYHWAGAMGGYARLALTAGMASRRNGTLRYLPMTGRQ